MPKLQRTLLGQVESTLSMVKNIETVINLHRINPLYQQTSIPYIGVLTTLFKDCKFQYIKKELNEGIELLGKQSYGSDPLVEIETVISRLMQPLKTTLDTSRPVLERFLADKHVCADLESLMSIMNVFKNNVDDFFIAVAMTAGSEKEKTPFSQREHQELRALNRSLQLFMQDIEKFGGITSTKFKELLAKVPKNVSPIQGRLTMLADTGVLDDRDAYEKMKHALQESLAEYKNALSAYASGVGNHGIAPGFSSEATGLIILLNQVVGFASLTGIPGEIVRPKLRTAHGESAGDTHKTSQKQTMRSVSMPSDAQKSASANPHRFYSVASTRRSGADEDVGHLLALHRHIGALKALMEKHTVKRANSLQQLLSKCPTDLGGIQEKIQGIGQAGQKSNGLQPTQIAKEMIACLSPFKARLEAYAVGRYNFNVAPGFAPEAKEVIASMEQVIHLAERVCQTELSGRPTV